MTTTTTEYPEHEKLAKVKDLSQAIGEFLDVGLGEQGLAVYEKLTFNDMSEGNMGTTYDKWVPRQKSIQAILADYFDIDQGKLDAEKNAMLRSLRK